MLDPASSLVVNGCGASLHRSSLLCLSRSADALDSVGMTYLDLVTTLESLHDPQDLAATQVVDARPRAELYDQAQQALSELRDHGGVDPLEIRLLIGHLAVAWGGDSARNASYDGS